MAVRGERFDLDLGIEDDDQNPSAAVPSSGLLVKDIQERPTYMNANPPAPPTLKNSSSGFPAHKDRRKRFKFQQRQKDAVSGRSPPSAAQNSESLPKTFLNLNGSSNSSQNRPTKGKVEISIDEENNNRLAQMSEEEIEAARQELVSGLSPSLIERLLKKANIEEDQQDVDVRTEPSVEPQDRPLPTASSKKVAFEAPKAEPKPTSVSTLRKHSYPPDFDPDAPPNLPPSDLQPASSTPPQLNPTNVHFPRAPGPAPDLDPSSPEFLNSLHETYFPSLPADPTTLSWMSAPTPADQTAYSPSAESLPPSALRFDFRGRLLPPRLSAQIPTTKGLHHHGHAPESAGYTIPELAHLARSSVPSQRCVAYQTLGRVLYRLGRGDFGPEGEDLCEGLWQLMDQGRVLEGMVEAAAKEGEGNRSVWVTATEACWLWRKGGGRRWKGR